MRKILGFVFLIISFNVFGQNPANYQYRTVFERLRGLMPDSALHIPRYNGAPSGLRVGSSTQAGAIGMDTTNHLFKYYSGQVWRDLQPIRDGLYSGGIVTWDSLLVFTVSAAVYYINGVRYETAITHITLDAANGSNPRIDLIVATASGISKITGTAAASPAEANLPIDNIRLTAIYVNTSATTPTGPLTKVIWDENTEFTGAATSVTTDFDNFADPYHFVKATSAGAVTSASFLTYTGADFSITPFNTFKFFVKLKASFASTTRFQITWYKDGVQVSTTLSINSGTYGFLRTSGTYQEITIPVFDFGITTEQVDQVKFALSGSNASGFYLDYIQLKGGIQQPTGGLNRFGVSGEDAVATQNRYFNGKNAYFFTLDSIPSLAIYANESRFKNLAGSNWLQYTASALIIDPLSTSIPVTINNIPYNSGAEVVHLGLDTLTNRLVRKTAGGGITGSGAANRLAFWTGTSSLGSSSSLLWDGSEFSVLGDIFTNSNIYANGLVRGGWLEVAEAGSFGTVASGFGVLWADATSLHYKNDAGTDIVLGAGGGSDTHFGANNLTQTADRTYTGAGFNYTFNNLGTWTKNFGSSQVLNQADYFKQSVIVGNAEGLFETFIDDAGGDQIILRLTSDNIRNTLTSDATSGFHFESQDPTAPGILSRIVMFPDSIQFQPSLGILNIDSLRTQYGDTTTWKPLVWSPDNKGVKKFNSWGEIGIGGGGSGTVNTGASLKAAYYPSAGTTVDDVTGVEFNNTNLLSKFTAQASTEVIMELRMAGSQTADPFVIKNSSGNNIFQFQKAGHFFHTSDGSATLQNADGFDIVSQIYGGNNARFLVSSGSGYDHRLVNVVGDIASVYTGFVNGGGVIMETNNALNFGTNKIVRATISGGGVFTLNGRFVEKQGADVASAVGAIALGTDGNAFEITGTSAITLISNVSFQNGAVVTLLFTSTASLTDGTANSGTDIGMELAGNTNFTGSTGATLTLRLMELGGTQRWYEISRSVQ